MKAALVQYSQEFENIEGNIEKINSLLQRNISDQEIIIFPEMTLTGYTMNSGKFAEGKEGISFKYFSKLAAGFEKHVFAGIIEKDKSRFYNTLVHFNRNGEIAARYRKIHLFSYAEENSYYSPGKRVVETTVGSLNAGLSICYDLRFPELYREYGKKRCGIVICIASWPVERVHHWKLLLRARAVENQCFMLGVNRTGSDPVNNYNGCSCVFDPMGEEIVVADDKESVVSCSLDLSRIEEVRERYRFLDDISLI